MCEQECQYESTNEMRTLSIDVSFSLIVLVNSH